MQGKLRKIDSGFPRVTLLCIVEQEVGLALCSDS